VNGYATKNFPTIIFLLLQTILYASFLVLDLTGHNNGLSIGIKYAIIILCFCNALLAGGAFKGIVLLHRKLRPSHSLFIQLGLLFTLIADYFLLLKDYYLYGVLAFIVVQQLYSIRLIRQQWAQKAVTLGDPDDKVGCVPFTLYVKPMLLRVGLTVLICFIIKVAGMTLEVLLIVSVYYFISILSNTIASCRLYFLDRTSRSNQLYAIGMMLFLLCDINVGLFNLTGFIELSEESYSLIYSLSSILMWTFYAPSQVLISMSCHYD
jgi:hypothetical protein